MSANDLGGCSVGNDRKARQGDLSDDLVSVSGHHPEHEAVAFVACNDRAESKPRRATATEVWLDTADIVDSERRAARNQLGETSDATEESEIVAQRDCDLAGANVEPGERPRRVVADSGSDAARRVVTEPADERRYGVSPQRTLRPGGTYGCPNEKGGSCEHRDARRSSEDLNHGVR